MKERLAATGTGSKGLLRHEGFARMFVPGELTVGLFTPIEAYEGAIPTMNDHDRLVRTADEAGFAGLWVRDVPLYDPSFGDAGQIYDPWVYLGHLSASTERIALATGSVVFTLRHPLHSAKAAASVDRLSGGRLVLGVASGDRPVEFPAFGTPFANDKEMKGKRFREALRVFRRVTEEEFPSVDSEFGTIRAADVLPKPVAGRVPVLVTGHSRQPLSWIAEHADGWLYYPQIPSRQARVVREWKDAVADRAPGAFKPFAQSLYVDLAPDRGKRPSPMHLGFSLGRDWLVELLQGLREAGVNHVGINLKFGRRRAAEVVEELGEHVLPHFPALTPGTSAEPGGS